MKKIRYIVCLLLVVGFAQSLSYLNAANADTYVDVSLVNQMPDPVEPGQVVELRFKFENRGSGNVDDIEVELLPEYPFTVEPGMEKSKNIGSLYGRQVGDEGIIAKFKLKVDDTAVEGSHELKIRYRINGLAWISPDAFSLNVMTHDAIIAVESVEAEEFTPGVENKLKIRLKNMADSLLKDVKVKLEVREQIATATAVTTTDYPFTPIGSTNEQTIDMVESGKTKDVVFNLIADPDAEPNSYRVPLKIVYSDELGTNYSKDLIIGLIIGDKPDLVVNLESSDVITSGSKGTTTIRFINKGTNNIKFCYVTLEKSDAFSILSPASVYIGNIDSDDYESMDFDLFVNKDASEVKLPLDIQYKDANNKEFREKVNIDLPLYSPAEAKKYGMVSSSNGAGIFIVLLLIVAGVVIYRKRKKKK